MKKSKRTKRRLGFRNEKPGEGSSFALDAIDRRILRSLQVDGLIANQVLADQVGLSPPACLKRVRRLRSAGVVKRTVSLLSAEAMGYPLLTVVRLKLDGPTEAMMHSFEARMMASPRVMQCMLIAGDTDYILLVRSRDVAHYQEFARRMLKVAPGVRAYTSEIVLSETKSTTELPVED
ncbi:Lrp/AsnC family transcriptional regulator [Bradyrhizobium sp. BEA-2-5]|uniref:Lrp/AsnC family transcriptional regulator n=1 Tax=Bradyrhizobium sp. BEA-2-5 TaxID=3080015 RepID=UPI00293EA2B3|nr:Lrp/AsnC family transcriptional regulator [Bradyrhizobium sp. BEA-2-5]WOH80666.1 Lrp/AsnC family transcriptional regulator [Bradyrhizobium sp. BEA-2-5]